MATAPLLGGVRVHRMSDPLAGVGKNTDSEGGVLGALRGSLETGMRVQNVRSVGRSVSVGTHHVERWNFLVEQLNLCSARLESDLGERDKIPRIPKLERSLWDRALAEVREGESPRAACGRHQPSMYAIIAVIELTAAVLLYLRVGDLSPSTAGIIALVLLVVALIYAQGVFACCVCGSGSGRSASAQLYAYARIMPLAIALIKAHPLIHEKPEDTVGGKLNDWIDMDLQAVAGLRVDAAHESAEGLVFSSMRTRMHEIGRARTIRVMLVGQTFLNDYAKEPFEVIIKHLAESGIVPSGPSCCCCYCGELRCARGCNCCAHSAVIAAVVLFIIAAVHMSAH
jgi:hypothetical protein